MIFSWLLTNGLLTSAESIRLRKYCSIVGCLAHNVLSQIVCIDSLLFHRGGFFYNLVRIFNAFCIVPSFSHSGVNLIAEEWVEKLQICFWLLVEVRALLLVCFHAHMWLAEVVINGPQVSTVDWSFARGTFTIGSVLLGLLLLEKVYTSLYAAPSRNCLRLPKTLFIGVFSLRNVGLLRATSIVLSAVEISFATVNGIGFKLNTTVWVQI